MFDPTTRCQHCGDTLHNHGRKKACKAPSCIGKAFMPWTREGYQQAANAAATKAKEVTQVPVIPAEPQREIQLTPNFQLLFTRFLGDAINQGKYLSQGLAAAQFADYPESATAMAYRAAVLRVFQNVLAPLTIALNSATTVAEIEQLRGVMTGILARVDQDATRFELGPVDEGVAE